jgi:hypothetical protein
VRSIDGRSARYGRFLGLPPLPSWPSSSERIIR